MELIKSGSPHAGVEQPRQPDLGPLQPLLDDPAVSEIMVNGPHRIFVERNGRKQRADAAFASETALRTCVERLFAAYGKRIGGDAPYADACLADGTRVNAIIAPIARFGMAVTLRKFSQGLRSIEDLVRLGSLNRTVAEFLVACIKGKVNILFSGGTSTGKTTLVQLLSIAFAPEERVITIEDAAELHFGQENCISLETRAADESGRGEVTLRHLLRNALRMAPDRIVVGEVRRMVGATLQLIVHMERRPRGRLVTAITEVRGVAGEDAHLILNDLFILPEGGELQPVMHYYPRFHQRLKDLGLLSPDLLQAAPDAPGGVALPR